MNRFPVATATSALGTMSALSVERAARDGAPQERDGVPVWLVTVLHQAPARPDGSSPKPAVEQVKVASQTEPKLAPMTPVTFAGLTANVWSMDGRNGVALSASGVQAARGDA